MPMPRAPKDAFPQIARRPQVATTRVLQKADKVRFHFRSEVRGQYTTTYVLLDLSGLSACVLSARLVRGWGGRYMREGCLLDEREWCLGETRLCGSLNMDIRATHYSRGQTAGT